MIPVRKALRVCQVSFKILPIRANAVRREWYKTILYPVRWWEPWGGVALDGALIHLQCAGQSLPVAEILTFWLLEL